MMFALSLPYVYNMYIYLHVIHMDHKIRLLFLVHFEEINGVIVVFHPLHKFTDMLIMYMYPSTAHTYPPQNYTSLHSFTHTCKPTYITFVGEEKTLINLYTFSILLPVFLILSCYYYCAALHLFILV